MINTDLIRALRHFQPEFIDFLNYTHIGYGNDISICPDNKEHYIITLEPSVYSTYGIYKLSWDHNRVTRLYSFPDKREMTLVEVKNLIADYKYKDDLYAIMKYIDDFLMGIDFDNFSENYYSS
jgi:hypothetical protein